MLVKQLLKAELQEEEERRIKLTEQQARVFRMLGNRKKAAICGGAGTGKTLLALQRARELAASGKKTLLLCYNQPLGDWLGICAAGAANLRALNFHKLCDEQIRKAKALANRDLVAEAKLSYPGEDEWDVLKPFALATSTEILEEKYDAIVIDEGQDFKDEYWLGIEMLFSNVDAGYLYIFYDDNQSLYKCSPEFPITEPPFVLTVNCRNTEFIHNFSYNFYEGDPTDPPEIKGSAIEFISANTLDGQATKVHALVLDLVQKEGVQSEQIVVLVGGKPFKSYSDKLEAKPLPKPNAWGSRLHGQKNTVLIETIGRFKGLESDVVIFWGIENLNKSTDREAFYVATSRAKSRLFIIGTDTSCNYLQQS